MSVDTVDTLTLGASLPSARCPGAAGEVFFRLRLVHPEITMVRADSGYAGRLVN